MFLNFYYLLMFRLSCLLSFYLFILFFHATLRKKITIKKEYGLGELRSVTCFSYGTVSKKLCRDVAKKWITEMKNSYYRSVWLIEMKNNVPVQRIKVNEKGNPEFDEDIWIYSRDGKLKASKQYSSTAAWL